MFIQSDAKSTLYDRKDYSRESERVKGLDRKGVRETRNAVIT